MHPRTILLLCHDCDLPNRVGEVPEGGSARCARCGGLLLRRVQDSLDRTLACALAALVLFVVANAFPFIAMKMQGNVTQTTLLSGIRALYHQGRLLVAGLVLLTTLVAPLLHITGLLYVVAPLKLGRRAPGAGEVFRLLRSAQGWSMMEVFLIGILVSLAKLAGMAQIVPGIALWSFAALVPVVAGAAASLDSHLVWERIAPEPR